MIHCDWLTMAVVQTKIKFELSGGGSHIVQCPHNPVLEDLLCVAGGHTPQGALTSSYRACTSHMWEGICRLPGRTDGYPLDLQLRKMSSSKPVDLFSVSSHLVLLDARDDTHGNPTN